MKTKVFVDKDNQIENLFDIISGLEKYQIVQDKSKISYCNMKNVQYFDTSTFDLLERGGFFRFIKNFGQDGIKSYFEYRKDSNSEKHQVNYTYEICDTIISLRTLLLHYVDVKKELSIDDNNLMEVLSTEINEQPIDLNYNNLFLLINNLNPELKLKFLDTSACLFDNSCLETSIYTFNCDIPRTYNKKMNQTALSQLDMAMQNFSGYMQGLGLEEADVFEDNPYLFFMNMFDTMADKLSKSKQIKDEELDQPENNNDNQISILPEDQSLVEPQMPDTLQNQVDNAELLNEIYDVSSLTDDEEYDPVWGNMMDEEPYDEDEEEIKSLMETLPLDENDLLAENFDVDTLLEPSDNEPEYEVIDPNDVAESQFGEDN